MYKCVQIFRMEQGKCSIFYKWAKIALSKGRCNIKLITATKHYFLLFYTIKYLEMMKVGCVKECDVHFFDEL